MSQRVLAKIRFSNPIPFQGLNCNASGIPSMVLPVFYPLSMYARGVLRALQYLAYIAQAKPNQYPAA